MNPHIWGLRLPTFVCIFELLTQVVIREGDRNSHESTMPFS